jgi:thiopurine S-methyltransferase
MRVEPDFWLERWQHNQIGFHRDGVNPGLAAYLQALQLPAGAHVFVPLCGKSHDLPWLAAQGYAVSGVELSPLAVRALFSEHGLAPQPGIAPPLQLHQHGLLRVFEGDFFSLSPEHLGPVDAIFDRGALVALTPAQRLLYAQHLLRLAPRARRLLVTLDYPQEAMTGPPFAVGPDEVRRLFQRHYDICVLSAGDVLATEPHLAARGLPQLIETVSLLVPRHA